MQGRPIRCGHAVAVNQSDVALFIFAFGRAKHLQAYIKRYVIFLNTFWHMFTSVFLLVKAQPASRQELKAK